MNSVQRENGRFNQLKRKLKKIKIPLFLIKNSETFYKKATKKDIMQAKKNAPNKEKSDFVNDKDSISKSKTKKSNSKTGLFDKKKNKKGFRFNNQLEKFEKCNIKDSFESLSPRGIEAQKQLEEMEDITDEIISSQKSTNQRNLEEMSKKDKINKMKKMEILNKKFKTQKKRDLDKPKNVKRYFFEDDNSSYMREVIDDVSELSSETIKSNLDAARRSYRQSYRSWLEKSSARNYGSENVEKVEKMGEEIQEKAEEEEICLICFENKPNAVLMPCGHGGGCLECAQDILKKSRVCFLCKSVIFLLIF